MSENRPPLSGEKILVTGPAGQIAFPLCARLAKDNEVWGIARFSNPEDRERIEKAGIQARRVDLADPDWGDLPDDFTIVLHIAAAIAPTLSYDDAITINAEGTGLLMSRFRDARACLVMSTTTVYSRPLDPGHAVVEADPLGEGPPPPFSPSYRASKLAQEGVARYAAREFGLPTTIARMDVAYGDNGGLPSMLLDRILAGEPVPISSVGTNLCDPIHEDDIYAHLPGLIEGASVPATITNWVGDVHVDIRDLCRYMAERVGREVSFVESDAGNAFRPVDSTRRRALAGPCVVDWKDGVRRMIEARHPELLG